MSLLIYLHEQQLPQTSSWLREIATSRRMRKIGLEPDSKYKCMKEKVRHLEYSTIFADNPDELGWDT